jgi:hypothetical protein
MVRPEEVDYLECERLGAVVACVSKGDQQGDLPKRDRLISQDHSIERVWAALELVMGKTQPLKGVEVDEVETAASIHDGLSQPGRPDQRVDNEGKPPRLGYAIRVVNSIKSDQGLRPAQVLQDRCNYGVDCSASKLELAPQLMGGVAHCKST